MSITALLPDPAAIHLDYIRPSLSAITLIVRATATHALVLPLSSDIQMCSQSLYALGCRPAVVWSLSQNGQLEGQVNRLKLIKRMMYGRAKFDLLRVRVLHSVR